MIKLKPQQKLFLAGMLCLANLLFLIYSLFSDNSFMLGYFLGLSTFSTYFLKNSAKEVEKEVKDLWTGLTESTKS